MNAPFTMKIQVLACVVVLSLAWFTPSRATTVDYEATNKTLPANYNIYFKNIEYYLKHVNESVHQWVTANDTERSILLQQVGDMELMVMSAAVRSRNKQFRSPWSFYL